MDSVPDSTKHDIPEQLEQLSSDALRIYKEALRQMRPERLIRNYVTLDSNGLTVDGKTYKLEPNQNIWVLGTGKAAAAMGQTLENLLETRLRDGIVIGPKGSKLRRRRIQYFEGGHPLPDKDSEAGARELLDLASHIPAGDIVFYAISGGSSALFEIPAGKLELDDIQSATDLLLRSGASIHDINVVRKHLSAVKGGQLLKQLTHTRLIDLVISDVPDDDLKSIGSGPTQPDPSTYEEAFQILKRHHIWEEVPHDVRKHLAKGMHGDLAETPKPGFDDGLEHQSVLIGSARKLAERAANLAHNDGYHTWMPDQAYGEDVETVATQIADTALGVLESGQPANRPAALLFYGESTVQVKGSGRGGRNQELAVRVARHLDGHHPVAVLSAGTDGRDGPTDAAGGLVTSATIESSRRQQLDVNEYLDDNNTYPFLDQLDTLLVTGPTGNNLMDLQIVLIG